MALAEICGFKDYYEDKNKAKNSVDFDILNGTSNFTNHMNLSMAPFGNPEKLSDFKVSADGRKLRIDFEHGTTTLGFMYQGGIVLAVDSRATGGDYIASQSMRKVVEINDYLLGTIAGGAADCVYWDRVLTKQCRLHELRNRERISVAAASKLMTNMIYNYKNMGLSIGMMIAGWDKRGPNLYYVDNDGTRVPGKVFSCGSGSPYAYGVLDSGYRYDLTDEEAFELGRRSIYHATFRDIASGGIVRVYHMTNNGWVHISDEDCKDLHYSYVGKK